MNLPKSILIILFISTALLSSCSDHETVKKPNIILILTDDQGFGDLSLTGNPDISTPNIDQLAQEGTFFDRFYVSAVCSPTRAELLTGRYAARSGVYSTSEGGERIDLDEETLGDVFKTNGYRTAAFGKWHSGMQPPYHPNARGFDEFYGFCSGHWGNYFDPILEHNGQPVKGEGFLTDDLVNKSLQYIKSDLDAPFFVYLPLNTPHSPMQVPDEFWEGQANKPLTTQHINRFKEDTIHTKAALAMVENIDWNIGRLLDSLDHLNLRENTIIIYLSDNGPNGNRWNADMKGTKGTVDEGGVRSPFIISWPSQIPAGRSIKSISSAMDILPTLVDLADLNHEPLKPIDGVSLAHIALGEEDSVDPDRHIINHWGERTSVRTQEWRLGHEGQLFNMIEDPSQTMDVGGDNPDVLAELMGLAQNFKNEVLIELPETDERPVPVGDPEFTFTQLPARDAQATGEIKRSNRWPNCSFYTNWVSEKDSIFWDVEVLKTGRYRAITHYTVAEENVGCTLKLSSDKSSSTEVQITELYDPPEYGMENDRVERIESYVKDFKTLDLGVIELRQGSTKLALSIDSSTGAGGPDIRLLMLHRLD